MKKRIIVLTLSIISWLGFSWATDRLNPPYPRTGIYCNGGNGGGGYPAFSIGTWCEKIAQYDLAIITAMDEEGVGYFVPRLRALNPTQILIGMGVNSLYFSDPPEFYLYRAYRGHLIEPVYPGQREIKVDTIEGIYAGYDLNNPRYLYIVIGNDVVDVAYVADGNTIIAEVTDTTSHYAVNEYHPIGSEVKSPLRMSGPGIFPNFSTYCPQVDSIYAWDHLAQKVMRKVKVGEYNLDGLFHDYFSRNIYIPKEFEFDFDLNGVGDLYEHNSAWVEEQWFYGLERWIIKERQLMQASYPQLPNLLSVNNGGTLENGFYQLMNGHLFEGFLRWGGTSLQGFNQYFTADLLKWMNDGLEPSIMMINDYIPEKWIADGKEKNNFSKMRFGLATSMIYECYYAMTFGDWYYLSFWYDEFETDMGYPVDNRIITLPNGVKVRYFTKGCVLANSTGQPQTVLPEQLEGGPYYRLKGGQCPSVNTGALVDQPIALWGATYGQNDWRGDGILLFKQPTYAVADIIIDNFNLNDTSPGSLPVELSGSWTPQRTKGSVDLQNNNPYFCQLTSEATDAVRDQAFGHHVTMPGDGTTTATWRPTIGVAGYYEISEWHGWAGDYESSADEATNVPFEIQVQGQVKLRGIINQRSQYGRWNTLAYLYLPVGRESFVRINNKANGVVLADAMRFRYLGPDYVPDITPPSPPKNVKIIP